MNAARDMFVREAVKEVLRQCAGHLLLEKTVMQQVNLQLAPPATPTEIARALEQLKKKGRVDFEVDEEDQRIRRWKICES